MSWRKIETVITDHIRRRGGYIISICGRPHLAVDFFDDGDDGHLLETRTVLDIESLARAIEDNT